MKLHEMSSGQVADIEPELDVVVLNVRETVKAESIPSAWSSGPPLTFWLLIKLPRPVLFTVSNLISKIK